MLLNLILTLFVKKQAKNLELLRNKSLPHSRSEIIAIKLSSNIPVLLLTTDLDVYFSIFKQCIT